jgi:putative transposase
MDIGRRDNMPRQRYTTEQIIGKLREAEVLLSQGQTIGHVSRGLGISDHTYYRWRKEYGGLRTDQAQRLKSLEQENSRLKRIVADLSLDNAMLRETVSGN